LPWKSKGAGNVQADERDRGIGSKLMTDTEVREAYTKRASEYSALFGSVGKADVQDQRAIASWAGSIQGPVLDAGCGPGHWTDFLARNGADVEGVDLVPAFVQEAKARFPTCRFRVASFTDLGISDGQISGILAWYSLIHLQPEQLQSALLEFLRCLAPGGTLLTGFFDGPDGETLPHAVTTAHFWSTEGMAAGLARAGFEVLDMQARADPGQRPHAAIIARRRPSGNGCRPTGRAEGSSIGYV
jgi:SAM-dependent methyltransferase